MKKLFRVLGVLIAGLLVADMAHADPLTFYYDQASWLAAASGLPISTYSSASTEVDNFVTVQNGISSSFTTTKFTPDGGFSNVGNTLLPFLLFECNPTPTGCTALRSIVISLSSPIMGFEGHLSIVDAAGSYGTIELNGMPLNPEPFSYSGFFGVIGQISTLDFECACGLTDNPLGFGLSNIQVAVDEPPSIALVLGLSLLLVGTRFLRIRRSTRPCFG